MANPISICSQALVLLGDKPIQSFTNQSARASLCALLYPDERKALMRDHPWNCLVKRVQLAPEATPPLFGYGASFVLPAECLRLLSVGDECQAPIDYQLEGQRRILTQGDPTKPFVLNVRYVADLAEAFWDDQLVDLMKIRMASKLAYPITKSTTVADGYAGEYMRAAKRARAVDGQENPPEQITDSPLLAARFGGRTDPYGAY